MNNITIGKFAICRSESPAPSNLFESYEPTTPASEKNVNQAEFEDESILMPWEREVRLPRSVLPKHYDLYLHPNLQLGTFAGIFFTISILIQCRSYLSKTFVFRKSLNRHSEPGWGPWLFSHSYQTVRHLGSHNDRSKGRQFGYAGSVREQEKRVSRFQAETVSSKRQLHYAHWWVLNYTQAGGEQARKGGGQEHCKKWRS